MARKLFERQAIRRRTGALAAGVTMVVYSDAAGTVLADISTSVGGSAIPGSIVTSVDIAGLGPAALRFYGPPDGTDVLYIRVPSDTSLGVQAIEAATDPRLDALEAGVTSGLAAHEADTTVIHGIVDTSLLETLNTTQTVTGDKTHTGHDYWTSGRPHVDVRPFATIAAAIAAAPTGSQINLGPGTLAASMVPTPFTLLSGMKLRGEGARASTITGTAGQDVIVLPNGGTQVELEGFKIQGGARHIVSTGCTFIDFKNLEFESATAECMDLTGQNEEWRLRQVVASGGTHSFRVRNSGTNPLFDKSTFDGCVFGGASVNDVRVEVALSTAVLWHQCTFNTAGQHSVYLDGGISDWTWIVPATEGGGQTGTSSRSTLTGTVAGAATSGTLADATGWAASGTALYIQGAGATGTDHNGGAWTRSGTAISWTSGTVTSVTTPKVTTAVYDDFFLNNSISTPNYLTFIGGKIGGEGTGGHLRYSINNSIGSFVYIVGTSGTANVPVYDPALHAQGFASGLSVRTPKLLTDRYPTGVAAFLGGPGSESNQGFLTSPAGKDLTLLLADSTLDTAGTLGNLAVRLANANRTSIFEVQSDGDVVHWGLDASSRLYLNRRLEHAGTHVGFFGTAPATKPTVSGSRGGNAALASLLTALAGLGLVTDSSSA